MSKDLFKSDRRESVRPDSMDRRLYVRATWKLRLRGFTVALAVFTVITAYISASNKVTSEGPSTRGPASVEVDSNR